MSTRATWVLTVVSETTSSSAISALESPRASELEDLELARGELVEAARRLGRRRGGARELLDQAPGDRRRQQRLALGHDADPGHELLGRDVLEQEAAGPGAQRLVDVLVEVEGGQHQHPHRALAGGGDDPARRLDAVELGHADVHEHDVGLEVVGHRHRLGAVGGLADDVEVVLGVEDHLEPGAHERLVVGDQDANGHLGGLLRHGREGSRAHACSARPSTGIRARTSTPAKASAARPAPRRRAAAPSASTTMRRARATTPCSSAAIRERSSATACSAHGSASSSLAAARSSRQAGAVAQQAPPAPARRRSRASPDEVDAWSTLGSRSGRAVTSATSQATPVASARPRGWRRSSRRR